MLIPNHPGDERLSALAFGDADAVADETLVAHVAACDRCTEITNELGALGASLAELPDVAPARPLRLLPEADEPRPDRLGAWARRIFGPVMAAGAALALVGMVGTVAPSLSSSAAGDAASQWEAPGGQASAEGGAGGVETLSSDGQTRTNAGGEEDNAAPESPTDEAAEFAGIDSLADASAERSPWPMVLFTGIALVIAAALLRWILVPRAG